MANIIRFRTSYVEPYPLQVEGESYLRKEIANLFPYLDDEGINQDDLVASLILDDNNPHDPNAVRVEIDGTHVGYISKNAAKLYRSRLAELGHPNATGTCYASIRGGFRTRDGDMADFGVRLDLNLGEPLEIIPIPAPSPPTVTPAPAQSQPPATPKKNRPRWIIPGIIAAAITAFCCLCLEIALIYNQTPAGQAAITQRSADRTATYQVISTPVP